MDDADCNGDEPEVACSSDDDCGGCDEKRIWQDACVSDLDGSYDGRNTMYRVETR